MPIHDYRCKECGYTSEEISPPKHCRQCQAPDPERLFPTSPPTPYFKSSGFYITDYNGRNTPKENT